MKSQIIVVSLQSAVFISSEFYLSKASQSCAISVNTFEFCLWLVFVYNNKQNSAPLNDCTLFIVLCRTYICLVNIRHC